MYCKICGQDGPGDGISCTYCGSKLLAKEITLEQLEGNSSDALNDPSSDYHVRPTFFPNWKWIVLAGFIVLIGILLCFSGFRSSLVRALSSPSGLMEKAYSNAIERTFSYAQNVSDWSPGDDISAHYQADVEFGDVALSLLADAIDVQAEDLTELSNVELSCDASYQNDLLKAVYDLTLCGNEIGTLEHYVDPSKMEQWILLPKLNEQALLIKTSDEKAFSEVFDFDAHTVAQLDPQMLTDISVYYTHMFIDGFENINKYRENVICNGIKQKMTVLQATISTEQLYRTLIAILEDAAVNPDVAYMISDMEFQHGRAYYDSFIESLEKQKNILQELLRQSNTYSDFTVYTYLNRKNEISGFKLEYTESGNLYPVVSCIVATKGLQFSVEVVLQNGLMIQGIGTVGEYINCSFSVFHSQQQICEIILNDFSINQDHIKGTVCVIPADEIVEHLFDQAQCYEAYLYANRLPDFQVELIINWDDINKEVNVTFYSDKAPLASTCLLIQSQEASPVVLPQSILDGNYESDYQLWSCGFATDALNALLERFLKIGINPEAINENSTDLYD